MRDYIEHGHYMRVLLAFGDQKIVEQLLSMLNWEELGFKICGTAENGRDAWTMFIRNTPDAVITDTKLPLLDGLTFAKNIRQKMPDMPVLFLSAQEDFDTVRQAVLLGASGYLLHRELSAAQLGKWLLSVKGQIRQRSSAARLYRRNCLETFLCAPENPARLEALTRELAELPAVCWGMLLVGEAQNMLPFVPWNQDIIPSPHNYLRQQICAPEVLDWLRREHQCQIIAIPCQSTSVLILVCFAHSLPGRNSQFTAIRRVAEVIWNACDDNGRRPTVLYRDDVFSEVSQIYSTYLSLIQHYRYTVFSFSHQIVNFLTLEQMVESRERLVQSDPEIRLSGIEYDQIIDFLEKESIGLSRAKSLTRLEGFLQEIGDLLDSLSSTRYVPLRMW